jgi:S-adenosylmethionine synthetase
MGHPDKVADQIADGILDTHLEQDRTARVACEILIKNRILVVSGEITSKATVDYSEIARKTLEKIGYTGGDTGFDFDRCNLIEALEEQSPDIAQGVTRGEGLHLDQGAGDQGQMFGYACNETPELMPLPLMLARRLTDGLSQLRQTGKIPYLRPDGKTQVTVVYEDGKPTVVDTVVVSAHHAADVEHEQVVGDLTDHLIREVLPPQMIDGATIHVNPTGRFSIGGPEADCGLSGRKIIVDTYGGMGRHGGGSFSGKDPSKVDRSATYAARLIAKNIVAAGLAERCEVQVAYAIGVAEPVSINVNSFGTGKKPDGEIAEIVGKHFDLRPRAIIEQLQLLRPIYEQTARLGHFGREMPDYTWEGVEKAEAMRSDAGL